MLRAISAIHSIGFLHRDIKPVRTSHDHLTLVATTKQQGWTNISHVDGLVLNHSAVTHLAMTHRMYNI